MSSVYFDGFDDYVKASLGWFWDTIGSSSIDIVAAEGRNNTAALYMPNGVALQYLRKNISNLSTFYLGVACELQMPGSTSPIVLLSFWDGTTVQVSLEVDATGHLRATRWGTVLGTSTLAVSFNTWHYLEFMATIHDTAGVVEVRADGIQYLYLTGQDTKATTNAYVSAICLSNVWNNNPGTAQYGMGTGATTTGFKVWFDDLYFNSNAGSKNNGFLGDRRVQSLFPTGAGNYAQWTPLSGQNYQNVDENPPNDDTDYNSTGTVGNKDSFAMGDLSSLTGEVDAVMVLSRARAEDAGSPKHRALIRSGGVDGESSDFTLDTTYKSLAAIFETSPSTSLDFTVAEVNSIEAGYKKES